MLWTAMGLLCGAAVLFRVVTRRGRRQIWWLCATAAPATTVAAGVVLGNEHTVSGFLDAPNVAILLAGLCSVTGAGLSQIFWHAVRHEVPSRRAMLAHAGLALLVGLVMITIWLAAPIHEQAYASFREIPITAEYVMYALSFQTYFAAVQVNAGLGAWQLLHRPPIADPGLRDPGLRIALMITVPTAATAFMGQVFYLVRLAAEAAGESGAADLLLRAADVCTLLAMAGYSFAGITVLVGPRLHAALHARRLVSTLTPLWHRLRELYPAIALPVTHVGDQPSLRAHRMLIEIGDGLNLLPVSLGSAADPVQAVTEELLQPSPPGPRSQPASFVLPSPSSTREETALFTELAQTYAVARGRRGAGRPF